MTERSTGIWICAILFAVGGILCILGGLIFIMGGMIVTISDLEYTETAKDVVVVEPFALIGIILGVVFLAVAYGIWNMKEWAKIAGIILAIGGGILWFPSGTIIAIIILYFLLIDKNTKDLFK